MPRLVFSGPDLGRVRFAVMPFQETLKAARGLGLPQPPPGLAAWRHAARRSLPAAAAPVLELCGAHPRHLPDFLTPQPPAGPLTFADELSAALDDPTAPVRADTVAFTAATRTSKRVFDDLVAHPDRGRRALARSFVALHRAVLADHWPQLHAQLAADVAHRARLAARHGVEAMLATLSPDLVRWRHPGLEYAGPPEPDYPLDGRGLVLVPSMFLTDAIHRQLNDRQQPMLFYPARTARAYWRDPRGFDGSLTGAIGPQRAAVLRLLAERPGRGTGELAAVLGVAPSTASAHVAHLRRAGLATTVREARRAVHEPTPLGWALLETFLA